MRTAFLVGGLQGTVSIPGLCRCHRSIGLSWSTDPTAPCPPARCPPSPGRQGWMVPFTEDKPEPQGATRIRGQPVPRSAANVFVLAHPPTARVMGEAEGRPAGQSSLSPEAETSGSGQGSTLLQTVTSGWPAQGGSGLQSSAHRG